VKAIEIIYAEIGSTSDHHFVKLNEVEKKIDHMETLVVEMFNYGIKCKL
jgi:hypothetical protein